MRRVVLESLDRLRPSEASILLEEGRDCVSTGYDDGVLERSVEAYFDVNCLGFADSESGLFWYE